MHARPTPCTFMLVYVCICAYREHAGARVARIHAREIDEQRRHYVGFDDDIDFLAQSLPLLLLLYVARFAKNLKTHGFESKETCDRMSTKLQRISPLG